MIKGFERSLVGVALDLAPEFTLGYRIAMVGTWGWTNSKIRRQWFDSPHRQFNLAGAHVNPDELCQLNRWFSLASDIASRLLRHSGNSQSNAADHVQFEDPRNGITDVSVNAIHLLERTGVLEDFDQLAPTGRILFFSAT